MNEISSYSGISRISRYNKVISLKELDMEIKMEKEVYERLLHKRKKLKREDKSVRILLRSTSCHGADLGIYFTRKEETDEVCQYQELEFIADKKLVEMFEGFEIDYENFFLATRFKIIPFKDEKDCSCGANGCEGH